MNLVMFRQLLKQNISLFFSDAARKISLLWQAPGGVQWLHLLLQETMQKD